MLFVAVAGMAQDSGFPFWFKMKPSPKKRGRGQPAKEPTQQIRAYSADVPKLAEWGDTQAAAVRVLLVRAGSPFPANG